MLFNWLHKAVSEVRELVFYYLNSRSFNNVLDLEESLDSNTDDFLLSLKEAFLDCFECVIESYFELAVLDHVVIQVVKGQKIHSGIGFI